MFFGATLAGLALVLGLAARARFAWPQWPVADPDTWGYLYPALGKLEGAGFVHTYGRNFLYPGFVYGLLRCGGTFRAIPVAQHLLGLACCGFRGGNGGRGSEKHGCPRGRTRCWGWAWWRFSCARPA